jgi:metal-responsive CopG/Arc/MetJ family transcriptional regulator
MKTAISIPDELFQTAEKIAKKMGIPRSQLYVRALEEFIQSHSKESVTEKLNAVYSGEKDTHPEAASRISIEMLRRSLKNDTW